MGSIVQLHMNMLSRLKSVPDCIGAQAQYRYALKLFIRTYARVSIALPGRGNVSEGLILDISPSVSSSTSTSVIACMC